jgi:O-antigen/teichoic acid export membrane protein
MTRSMLTELRRFGPGLSLRHRPVFLNAASLFGSTVVTSFLGFAFWVVAARAFPMHGVGVASAAISAMQLLATVGIFGMGTLMIGELADGRSPKGLVSAAMLAAALACGTLATSFVLLRPLISAELGPLGEGLVGPLVFVTGVAVTGATLVLDQACIGMSRGVMQLVRNCIFSFVKLALLPAGLLLGSGQATTAIYGVWLAGNLISFAGFALHARRIGFAPSLRPALRSLAAIRSAALAHHWLNLAAQAPRLILPVLVAATLTPELNAAFYTAVLIVSFAAIVPVHLSTALFALPKGDTTRLASELRETLRVSALIGVVSAIAFALLSRTMLSMFGASYVVATDSMIVLGITTLPFTIKVHYAAVCRVQGRLTWCAAVSTAGGLLEIACCYVGARLEGLVGVSIGFLIALTVEAVLLWPTVARAARLPTVLHGRLR